MDASLCERILYLVASPVQDPADTKCATKLQLGKLMRPTDGIDSIRVLAGHVNYKSSYIDGVNAKPSLHRLGKLCLQLWNFVTRWQCRKLYLNSCSLNDDVAPYYSLDIAARSMHAPACETFLFCFPSCGIELSENVFKLRIPPKLTWTYQPKNLHGSLARQADAAEMQGTTKDTTVIAYDPGPTEWSLIAGDPKRILTMATRKFRTLVFLP